MGAWGHKIRENDTTLDVINTVTDFMRKGLSCNRARAQFLALPQWREILDDPHERALINQALADVAWTYEKVPAALLKAVKADFAAQRSLIGWRDPQKRTRAVASFIAKISRPNPRPKTLPKPEITQHRLRSPGFSTGDCLAVKLKDGRYGAAFVVQAVQPIKGQGYNIVVELNYLARERPPLQIFGSLKPLVLTHHAWDSEIKLQKYPRREKHLEVTVVGNLKLDWPKIKLEQDGNSWINWAAKPNRVAREVAAALGEKIDAEDPTGRYLPSGPWDLGSQILLQERWDKDKRKPSPTKRK